MSRLAFVLSLVFLNLGSAFAGDAQLASGETITVRCGDTSSLSPPVHSKCACEGTWPSYLRTYKTGQYGSVVWETFQGDGAYRNCNLELVRLRNDRICP